MPSKEYAPSGWGGSKNFEFTLPSGDKCLLRRLDPMDLLEAGLLDKLDFVTSRVMSTHVGNASKSKVEQIKAQRAKREAEARGEDPGEPVIDIKSLMKNSEQFKNLKGVLNQVLVMAVVSPEMHLPPNDDDDRKDGLFYTDTVPFNDKMAIFNHLMRGVNTLEQFREESGEAVGDVAPEPSVRKPAQRRPRTTGK